MEGDRSIYRWMGDRMGGWLEMGGWVGGLVDGWIDK